jgi:hypothetical protein
MSNNKNKGELIITKEIFIEILLNIQNQSNHDDKCNEAFKIILPDTFGGYYNNSFLHSSLLYLLKIAFNDNHKDSWIDYFIYELDFGSKYKNGCVTNKDGSNIDLSTSEKLYDFLINE